MPAPKGNQYAIGNKGGQPPLYSCAEDLENKIIEYFDYCNENNEPLTVTGLALFLGFESRQSLYDYKKKNVYSYIIKRATLVIENGYEKNLHGDKNTGSIFALKNMGWIDTHKVDTTTETERQIFKIGDTELEF